MRATRLRSSGGALGCTHAPSSQRAGGSGQGATWERRSPQPAPPGAPRLRWHARPAVDRQPTAQSGPSPAHPSDHCVPVRFVQRSACSRLGCSCVHCHHAFAQYGHRHLADHRVRFNPRFDLRAILARLLMALVAAPPASERQMRAAETGTGYGEQMRPGHFAHTPAGGGRQSRPGGALERWEPPPVPPRRAALTLTAARHQRHGVSGDRLMSGRLAGLGRSQKA